MYMYIALFHPTGLKLKLKFIRSKMMVNCVQLVIIIPWHLGKKIEVNLCKKKNQTNKQTTKKINTERGAMQGNFELILSGTSAFSCL